MKRIQGILSIIAFFIAISVSAQNINKAEYFFDADPGVGNGTDIPLSIVGDSITLPIISAPTNSLTMGLHTLYVRVKDVTDKWSIVESTPFAITPTQNNNTQLIMSLDKAEYFFDTDPGVGNGIDLPLSMTGDSITVDNATITLNNLSLGVHQLYIRVRTSANRWSNVEVHPILVANTPTTNTVTTTTIDKAEYFVDTDPGVGNGIDFPLGSLGDTITVENGAIVLNNLSLGVHQLYIRVRTSANRWSNVEVHPILVANPLTTNTVTTTTINKAEYFVDTDPGVGNGVDLPLGMVGDSVWVNNLNIQVGNLSNGEHQVYVRVRDVKGNWSTLANHLINIEVCTPSVSITASATTITAGTSVAFTPSPTNGGGNPTYIWKKNGNQVSTDATYITTDLANGDVITCEMTSNASCVSTPTATSNSVTMTVNLASTGRWVNVGSPSGDGTNTTIAFHNNTPYVAYLQGNAKPTVLRYNNTTWEALSSDGMPQHAYTRLSFAMNGSVPYVVFNERYDIGINTYYKPTVMRLSGTTWEAVGERGLSNGNAISPVITFAGNTPYIAYADVIPVANTSTYKAKINVKRFNGTDWELVGSDFAPNYFESPDYVVSLSLIFNNNTPYVSCKDAYHAVSVFRFNGINWETVGNAVLDHSQVNVSSQSLAFVDNTPYFTFGATDEFARVMRYNGIGWEYVGCSANTGFSVGRSLDPLIVNNNNTLYVAYQDWSLQKGVVKKFNGTTWESVGGETFSDNRALYLSLAFNNNIPYTSFSTILNNIPSQISVKRYCESVSTPSVSIAASATTITVGTSVTFTPTPTNGGTTPTYQWKKNGLNVATTDTYTTTDLLNGDIVTCEMTSNLTCVTTPLAISNSITMVVLETPASSLHFDGTNDYVTLPNSLATAATGGDAITIEFWFKGTSMESAVRMQDGGYIVCGYGNTHFLSNDGQLPIGNTVVDGNWHHVAMTWQRNTTNGFRSYLDGVLVAEKNASNTPLPTINSGIWLGSFNGNQEITKGRLDEVRIWNRALPQCEIQNSMNCELGNIQNGLLAYYKFNQGNASSNNAGITTLTDDSGNGYHGTLNNFALTGQTSNWVLQGGVTTGISCPASDISLSIAITSGSQTTRLGTPVTFTVTPVNVGVNPVYQWKKNNTIVQTDGTTYTDATLLDGDVITCLFTSTVCGLPQTVTSNSIKMTVLPDNAILTVGIALYPDPLNKDQLLVKIKPNLTVSNYPYSAGIFTVKFPTSYNTTLSGGSSTYGFTIGQSDAMGSNTYYSFNYEGFSLVNWVADEEVTVAVLKHSGSCISPGVFEIVNDTWTHENNADYYQELNGESAEGAIYQPIASISCMDIAAPTFTRPADITINTAANCIYDASTTITGDVTDEADNCSTDLQATYTDVTTIGSCIGNKTIKRTWHLVDACGNTTDKVQTITVEDKTAPTFTCPIDLTINTLADCTYVASLATTGDVTDEADNCSTGLQATYTDVVTNGSCKGSKTITRTWHLADACGNSIDKVQTITVEDKTAPTFTRPADITISTAADCTYDVSLATTGDVTDEADNCSTGLQAIAVDFVENGSCTSSKTITRTWTLTDDCGNKTTKTQTITVIDNIKPTISAPSDISVNVNAAACSATVTLSTPTDVADNCTASPTVTNDAPSVFPLGNTTVVWTVTDACGNTKTATQIVSVKTTLTPTNIGIQSSTICSNQSTNLSFTISGGQSPYSVVYTEGGISQTVSSYTSGQNISVSPTTTTTYTLVSVTDAFGCTKTATGLTTTLTVTPIVGTPTPITGPASVCQDDADATYSTTATNSVSVAYSVSPAEAGVINATTGVMNWATAFTGTATITATAMGCGGSTTSVSKTVTVNPLPTLNIVAPNPVCLDFNLASLVKTFSPAGGSFSYHATLADANSNNNPINSLVTTSNTYYVRYTLSSGCFITSSASVTVGACVTVNSKVMLQGPYNTTTQLMNDNLRANTLIPTSDPYSDVSLNTLFIPVNHGGIKTTTAAVLALSDQNAIVDWVFLELRDLTTNTQVVATRSALVQRDGDIVDMDGVSPVQFIANRAFYYLVVRHRNHLGIMTATPIDYRTGSASMIDFTSLSQATYGSNARKQVTTGTMALWSGNANLQGTNATRITYNGANNDRVAILNRLSGNPLRILAGYYLEDVNMDGIVKYNNSGNDRVIILNNLSLNPLGILIQQIP